MRKSFELFNKINNASIDLQMNFSCLHISMSTMRLIVLSVFFKHSFQTRPHLTIQMLKKFSRGCTLQTEPSLLRNRALSHILCLKKLYILTRDFFYAEKGNSIFEPGHLKSKQQFWYQTILLFFYYCFGKKK
jgi:hypothetical protein